MSHRRGWRRMAALRRWAERTASRPPGGCSRSAWRGRAASISTGASRGLQHPDHVAVVDPEVEASADGLLVVDPVLEGDVVAHLRGHLVPTYCFAVVGA